MLFLAKMMTSVPMMSEATITKKVIRKGPNIGEKLYAEKEIPSKKYIPFQNLMTVSKSLARKNTNEFSTRNMVRNQPMKGGIFHFIFLVTFTITNPNPCIAPNMTKVHWAPCQSPAINIERNVARRDSEKVFFLKERRIGK